MGLHVQQQILQAVAALLVAGDTMAGDAVFVDRMDPLPKGVRHAILVREGDEGEDITAATIRDLQQRDLQVQTLCAIKGEAETAAAESRAFALQVEKLVSPNQAGLRALCKAGWRLTGSRLEQSGEGEEAVAARVLTWRFSYIVSKATPDVAA